MSDFSVNSSFLYLLTSLVIIFVLAQSLFFLVKAARRARQLGMQKGVVSKTIASSALFTIAPAVAGEQQNEPKPRVIVVGQNYGSILTMVRDLGKAGYDVAVVRVFKKKPSALNILGKMAPERESC